MTDLKTAQEKHKKDKELLRRLTAHNAESERLLSYWNRCFIQQIIAFVFCIASLLLYGIAAMIDVQSGWMLIHTLILLGTLVVYHLFEGDTRRAGKRARDHITSWRD